MPGFLEEIVLSLNLKGAIHARPKGLGFLASMDKNLSP
jgi:hypothetical protein